MNYLRNTVWNKRIPSVIGVLFLVLSIGTIGWLSSNAVLFGTKAAAANIPKNVKITNISDSAFSVSYLTDDKVAGTVNYGKNQPPNQVALDDRDQQGKTPIEHSVHHITVKNLEPSTKYFFTITSGNETFLNNNTPYEATTKESSNPMSDEFVLAGKVALEDGQIPSEAIIYAAIDNSESLSALTDVNGKYQINLSPFTKLDQDTILDLEIFDSKRESKVSLLASQANPVPLIILSKDYDFSISNEPLPPSPVASASGTITPAAFPTIEGQKATGPQILSPEEDQKFKDQQPLFTGKAIPNAEVEITIESEEPIKTTIKASANGNWQYRPDTKLAPGNHTITIRTVDASGIIRTITQSFVVFAEGSEFTEPSIPPSANPTSTPSPTIAPTAAPTATPTITAAPTTSPSLIAATATLAPTAPAAPIPVTGNTALIVSIIGVISAVGIGALLFFLTAL